MLGSIIYFVIVTIFLGFSVDLLVKGWKAGFLEKIFIRIGVGTALFTVLGVFLNFIHVPLDWRVFLCISIIVAAAAFYLRKERMFNFSKITKSQIYSMLMIVMFIITVWMYIQGAFAYPWLEDGDPYGYALASKYIGMEETFTASSHFNHYIEPYTQGYQILIGVVGQTNDSIYWTLKYFTALIVSLSIPFFYYFVRRFTKKEDIALYSTFALFAIPCWLSHFVFSFNFNMALFPLALYVLVSIGKEKNWKYIAMMVFASILINHVQTGLTILFFAAGYYLTKIFISEELKIDIFLGVAGGMILSLFFFVPSWIRHSDRIGSESLGGMRYIMNLFVVFKPLLTIIIIITIFVAAYIVYYYRELLFNPFKRILKKKGMKQKLFLGVFIFALLVLIIPSGKLIDIWGTGDEAKYNLKDFFIVRDGNMINNPIGVGIVLMTTFITGMIIVVMNFSKIFKKENFWVIISFTWALISLLLLFGSSLSIRFIPFRMWSFFAIFASLIIGFALNFGLGNIKNKYLKWGLVTLFVLLVLLTSFSQKYTNNTSVWAEHMLMVPESQQLYVWMKDSGELPKNSNVVNPCHGSPVIFGYDMVDPIAERRKEFVASLEGVSLEEEYNIYKENDVDYVVLGTSCIISKEYDENGLELKINGMVNSAFFEVVRSTNAEILFKVI